LSLDIYFHSLRICGSWPQITLFK